MKVKKCPCCGGESEILRGIRMDGNCHYSVSYVSCKNCKMRTRDYYTDGYYGSIDTEEDAVICWNKRLGENK